MGYLHANDNQASKSLSSPFIGADSKKPYPACLNSSSHLRPGLLLLGFPAHDSSRFHYLYTDLSSENSLLSYSDLS